MHVLGRYALGEEIARGGIASVHLGLVLGDAGFSRPVAIKRLLPALAGDPDVGAAFLDEARLASQVRHPNVVSTLDVREQGGELFLVLEYVHGASLAALIAAASGGAAGRLAPDLVSAMIIGTLRGLHAAHEATDDTGKPLEIVHRDVTPHNVLVGVDGVARVIDFGIAKAASRAQITREGQVKGKLGYLAPEQLRQNAVRATDVYGAGLCLWEALVGRRAFDGDNESAVLAKVMAGLVDRPGKHVPGLPPALDAVVVKSLNRDPRRRFATAEEMAHALEEAMPPARAARVAACVEELGALALRDRADRITALLAAREGTGPVTVPESSATLLSALSSTSPPTLRPTRAEVVVVTSAKTTPVARAGRASLFAGAALTAVAVTMMLASARSTASMPHPDATSLPPVGAPPSAALPLASDPPPAATVDAVAAKASEDVVTDAPIDLDELPLETPSGKAATAPAARRVGGAQRAKGRAAKPGCDPPYAIDGDGVRRYKKACLE